jgi:hypothetical protein
LQNVQRVLLPCMIYLLVVSIRFLRKEKILHTHPCNAGDLTIYQITLFVNLSARIMVKFRPFLRLSSEGGTEDAPEHRARPQPVFLAAPASLRQ